MKEYLTFSSVGGGSLEVDEAGDYMIPVENIICVDGGQIVTGVAIWSTTTPDLATNCSFYEFEISGSKTAAQEAFLKAIESKPGGRGSKVLLPIGTSITSWSFANEGIY
jgi:hypothetical protein